MQQKEKVVGILGGMGPEATLDCFAKIIWNTPASKDQDHLRMIIDCNSKIPDRTAAIFGEGESPLAELTGSALALERAGADFIIIPCVSAHAFLDDLKERIRLPVLSIFDAVAETIARKHPAVKRIGLLATTGTITKGLFQERLAAFSIATQVPRKGDQQRVMNAIYDIKKSKPARSRAAIKRDLKEVAEGLITSGAQGIVAGCTEIPLALGQEDLPVPYFDSLLLLAHAAIRLAGKEPKTPPA